MKGNLHITLMTKKFLKFVLQSVAGMVGVSVYILADTFFISIHSGADGLTVLNLVLPIYGLIYAIGAMIGIGSATRYAIRKATGEKNIDFYFTHALLWDIIISIPFILLGIVAPEWVLKIMGANQAITDLGINYIQIVLINTPFFMMNYAFTAFARNDNATTIAMIGSLSGSVFNIVFDYIFMFPMGWGLAGAALATAFSPVVTMLVCCTHYLHKDIRKIKMRIFSSAVIDENKNDTSIKFHRTTPSVYHLFSCCKLGVSAFVGEISSAVTTAVFNILILGIAGNIGVAAYGVIANISIVAMSIFNGISQGVQPLISNSYGKNDKKQIHQLLKLTIGLGLFVEIIIIASAWGATDFLIAIFNSEGNNELVLYAYNGMRLYFLGYLIVGINIILIAYYSATDKASLAFIASILRGAIAITICAVVMSNIWGINGIWLSFLAAEFLTLIVIMAKMFIKPKN